MTAEPRYRAEPLAWLRHRDRIVALHRARPAWSVVNETAAAIVRRCEGQGEGGASSAELRGWFATRFGDVEREEMEGWLRALESSRLLRRTDLPERPISPPGADTYRVEHAYIELLARCNLRCIHCFMEGSPEREERLEPEEVVTLVDDLARSGGRYVTLAGGEPLLYPHFAEVARHVAARGLFGTVITNGISLRPAHLELIGELGFNLAISLDGVTAEVNRVIRGRPPEPVIAALERAVAVLGADRVILSFTPVKANLGELERILTLMQRLGVKRLNLSLYEEVGRAGAFAALLNLDDGDRRRLMRLVYEKAVELAGRIEIDFNDTRDVLSQFSADRSADELHPLWRGVRVTSSGDVYPASFSSSEEFRLGNVRETSFAGILASPILRELYDLLLERDARTAPCRDCIWRQLCRGGSVASAYRSAGTLLAPDAYCAAYKEVFPDVVVSLAELAASDGPRSPAA